MQKQGQIHLKGGGNMAKQPLKGTTAKTYEVVNNFSRGYNTAIADDLLNDNVFKQIVNFIPGKEGNIQKRPGLRKSNLYNFILAIKNNPFLVGIKTFFNFYDESGTLGLDYMFNQLFSLSPESFAKVDKLLNLTIIDDNGLLDDLQNYESLLNKTNVSARVNHHYLSLLFIFRLTSLEDSNKHFIRIVKLKIECTEDGSFKIYSEIKNPSRDESRKDNYTLKYNGDDTIELAVYHNYYYFMNGSDAIIRVHRDFEVESDSLKSSIDEIYADSPVIYKPTAIEASNIGFNILSSNPLSFVDIQGTADAIRGIYYTIDGEPTQIIPYNKPFNIHILQSGATEISVPQYRPDNGEIDDTINVYKDFPGNFNEDKTIFECTGLDAIGSYEIKVTKGEIEFINYFKTGTVSSSDVGKVSDIKDIILSSKYCKFINNQLVLFGGHGYMFFSEYDNFQYYPNYNYVYVAETNDEEVLNATYFRQFYAIYTNKRLKRMAGSFGASDFGFYPLSDFVGCKNGHTVKQVENLLYFISDNGLYTLKQGYVGEGTENVVQVDNAIYGSYNPDNIKKALLIKNYYMLYSDDDVILYNYSTDAFYKFNFTKALSLDESGKVVYQSNISVPFQYMKEPSKLYYGYTEINYDETTEYQFDIAIQDFNEESSIAHDNYRSFNSIIETPFMSMGYPTHTKKFKQLFLKLYTEYGKFVPLYVTIKVDDKTVVSPTNYEIVYDNDTQTYYYVYKTESNKTLKGYDVLGTLELGEDIIGKRTMQILKLRIGETGRGVKVIISDSIDKDKPEYTDTQNINNFEISAFGVVYKLKKVKEG